MGIPQKHWKHAEECVARARLCREEGDRVLWLTLAQSWVRLADHVAQLPIDGSDEGDRALSADGGEEDFAEPSVRRQGGIRS